MLVKLGKQARTALQSLHSETGHVLLTTFTFVVFGSVIVALFGMMATYMVKIETMSSAANQAYWLAHSQALVSLNALLTSSPLPSDATLVVPTDTHTGRLAGHVETTVTKSTADSTIVTVVAWYGFAKHTVVFTWNDQANKLVQWQDGAPAPANN